MLQTPARTAAWTLVVALIVVTVCPIQFRPVLSRDPQLERGVAFCALGIAFGAGYARRWPWVAVGAAALVMGLEVGQILAPGRHGEIRDAVIKAGGALIGLALGVFAARLTGAGLKKAGAPAALVPSTDADLGSACGAGGG